MCDVTLSKVKKRKKSHPRLAVANIIPHSFTSKCWLDLATLAMYCLQEYKFKILFYLFLCHKQYYVMKQILISIRLCQCG